MTEDSEKLAVWDRHRSRLFGLAYRMLGTRVDAEDILQEAYIRLHGADLEEIANAEAWLVSVTTRLCIDRLRKASRQREMYVGPWLPEPLLDEPSPEEATEIADSLSLAFVTMLEELEPTERAVFLLHDIFDCGYPQIANIVGKSEPATRQMAHRARERVRSERHRFASSEEDRRRLIEKFVTASYAGDSDTLLSIFADDIALTADGGGIVNAAQRVVFGAKRMANLFTVAIAKHVDDLHYEIVMVNGEPALLEVAFGKPVSVTTVSVEDGRIAAIYRVMNPNKLKEFDSIAKKYSDDLSHGQN